MRQDHQLPVDSASAAHSPGGYLATPRAASFLGLSPRTLEKYRVIGGGPPYRKLGKRVVYALGELERWAEARRRDSTSDPGMAARGERR